MQANRRNLETVLSPAGQYIAPLFQRPYVWDRARNWEPLWEAVLEVTEHALNGRPVRPHFLGAIVLNQLSTATGTLAARELIDGQQRMTTLQILIAAARDHFKAVGDSDYRELFGVWVRNTLPPGSPKVAQFKVWPTNVDQGHFERVMTAGGPAEVYRSYGISVMGGIPGLSADAGVQEAVRLFVVGSEDEWKDASGKLNRAQAAEFRTHRKAIEGLDALIPRAYLYFHAVLSRWLGRPGDVGYAERAKSLWETVKDRLMVVVIDLSAEDEPQQIFETLNARGTPLLPADLVKNFLFQRVQLDGAALEEVYNEHWAAFDSDQKYWREEIRQGRFTRPRLDLFLQHYLTLTTGEETPATELFPAFQTWYRKANLAAVEHISRFRTYADVFRAFEADLNGSRVQQFFYRLDQLDTTTAFPPLLELFKRHSIASPEAGQIAAGIESYLVRRMVCGLTTRNYNRVFLGLINHLANADDYSPSAVTTYLAASSGDAARWPDDNEFSKAWLSRPLYELLSVKRVRMLLEALELQMRTDKSEVVSLQTGLEIEHMMPQHWQTHWPISDGETAEGRDVSVHTLGNLTLLTKRLNIGISNGPWAGKHPEIASNSILRLNHALPSTWDEAGILCRGKVLFEVAKRIWPHGAQM